MGGAERSLLDLLRYLDTREYYPIVSLPSEGNLTRELERRGVEKKIIAFHHEISRLSREDGNLWFHRFLPIVWYLLPTAIKMARFVRERNIDMIVTNGIKCHFIGALVSSLTRAKLIWHVRDVVGMGWLRRILRAMGQVFPDKIITNSDAVGSMFSGNGRRETVYNGIDLSHFNPEIDGFKVRAQLKVGRDTTLIGTIGHFAPLKGFEDLIEAMGEVVQQEPNITLALVGEAIYPNSHRYKQKLISLVDSIGLKDKVIFTGFRENIPELLASFDLFVLPSRSEGFGRVNLEAMAMGKPVISTIVGGIPEVVLDGVTGILVPPGDPKDLARAIMRLLHDTQLRESFGKEGRRRVEEHFTLQAHAQRIQEIYGETFLKG